MKSKKIVNQTPPQKECHSNGQRYTKVIQIKLFDIMILVVIFENNLDKFVHGTAKSDAAQTISHTFF